MIAAPPGFASPLSLADFHRQRQPNTIQFFAAPEATCTIMVCSHIWWTEHLALALRNLGVNVLLCPLHVLYTDDAAFDRFDELWNRLIAGIRRHKVDAILAGNAAGIAPHPRTGELLHHALGVPLVNYWWDEPRAAPPFARRGFAPEQYLAWLRDERTLNAIWDIDVLEEMSALFQVRNAMHLPLGCLPEFWPAGEAPVETRPLQACFLGNCHFDAAWTETDQDPLVAWARGVIDRKLADLDRPMLTCLSEPVPAESAHYPVDDAWRKFVLPWEVLNAVYMHRTRNQLVRAAFDHLHGKLALIGKGWQTLEGGGLRANAEHAGEKSGLIYAQSQACLNLFGGCVHGGMPLRPFDITASGGVLVTHYQRELPQMFNVDEECVAFRNAPEMLAALDRIAAEPAAYNAMARAGRQRTLADHTWSRRLKTLLPALAARFL